MTIFGTTEMSSNAVLFSAVAAALGLTLVAANWWRLGQARWRYRAWRNRRRHPELASDYFWADGENRLYIAQQMMMRDRTLARIKNNGSPGANYPSVYDYLFVPGHAGYRMISARRHARERDQRQLLKQIQGKD